MIQLLLYNLYSNQGKWYCIWCQDSVNKYILLYIKDRTNIYFLYEQNVTRCGFPIMSLSWMILHLAEQRLKIWSTFTLFFPPFFKSNENENDWKEALFIIIYSLLGNKLLKKPQEWHFLSVIDHGLPLLMSPCCLVNEIKEIWIMLPYSCLHLHMFRENKKKNMFPSI